jgi:hypothetical protein
MPIGDPKTCAHCGERACQDLHPAALGWGGFGHGWPVQRAPAPEWIVVEDEQFRSWSLRIADIVSLSPGEWGGVQVNMRAGPNPTVTDSRHEDALRIALGLMLPEMAEWLSEHEE